MSELSSMKNQALTERVAERLLQQLLEARVPSGTKLPNEYQLAERFGVGRGTVREAVKLLAAQGVLRVKHGSGTYVASLTPLRSSPLGLEDIEDKLQLALDLTDVRLMLEPPIAELAAIRRTEEEGALLAEYCQQVREKIQAGEDYLREDMNFHAQIAKCSHNMVVEPLVPLIDTAVISIANITREILLTATIETHQEITDCILARDAAGARAAMAMHLAMNRSAIRQEQEKSRKRDGETKNP